MKIEVIFPQEIEDSFVEKVVQRLLPHLQLQPHDDNLTPDEAAEFLKTSKEQIYQWVNQSSHGQSDFPYQKAGKLLRFSKNNLILWMKKNGKPLERG